MDFTLNSYQNLLLALQSAGYVFQTFEQFQILPLQEKVIILRHDIDKLPQNALRMAQMEHALGIQASYYIRTVKGTWNATIVKEIVSLGHELSYHYEDLSLAHGDADRAWTLFNKHLEMIRKFYPAKTICMHGSPLSKWDNRKLWEQCDYRRAGVIGEPYFDVDYSKMFYITDTGRGWNKTKVSVRDKVCNNNMSQRHIKNTDHLIQLIENGEMSERIMINTHPQRWFPMGKNWLKELVLQTLKNVAKRTLIIATTR